MAKLETQHPNADTELNYRNPFELLAATLRSAQCTDERVNQVTPALFARYGTPLALAGATSAELEPIIKPTGFFRAKSKSLIGMATAIAGQHGGEVPNTMEALVELPGVGRERIWADMDAWGYTFRLGSSRAFFERDAAEAFALLRARGLVGPGENPCLATLADAADAA